MTTCLGKSCSFGLPCIPFVNCCQFMYLDLSLLVLTAGYLIWLYQFLISAYLFTFSIFSLKSQINVLYMNMHGKICCMTHLASLFLYMKKALQALHDTSPLCLLLLLRMFWHKKISMYLPDFIKFIHYFKSIKSHNSVETFGTVMYIGHNMDHIYQCINKILSNSINHF